VIGSVGIRDLHRGEKRKWSVVSYLGWWADWGEGNEIELGVVKNSTWACSGHPYGLS
jgi:hypothetical protein